MSSEKLTKNRDHCAALLGPIFSRLAALLLFALLGCQPSSHPNLISARIEGSLDDGLGNGDRIILVLDTPVSLNGNPRTGLVFSSEDINKTREYSIKNGSTRNVLIIDIDSGFEDLIVSNSSDSAPSTSISLDLELTGLISDEGILLSGLAGPVDLEPPAPAPALLIDARWIDSDQSSTVNQEDMLLLRWDQPVQLSDQLRDRKLEISQTLVRLPVEGDRLGTSSIPARFLDGPLSRESRILLGHSPFLTISGIHDSDRSRYKGSPSGIAVAATTILPTTTLHTLQGAGVASASVIDLEGDCDPWEDLALPPQLPALEGYTLTHLPEGRALLTGGRVLRPSGGSQVSADAWILDPRGHHLGPFPMQAPRRGHTATVMPGKDTIFNTPDDYIILCGGWDGIQARNDAEILLLDSPDKVFLTVQMSTPPTSRFEHTAHRIGNSNSLIVVGGRLDNKLNGILEQLDIQIKNSEGNLEAIGISTQVGHLTYPRHQHASILFQDSEQPLLLIYGGYGGALGTPHLQLTAENCRILDSPEAFRLRTSTGYARPLIFRSVADLPGPRRGLHLFPLSDASDQGNQALLVAGTRREATTDAFSPIQISECRTGYTLIAEDLGRGQIRLDWAAVGRLPVEMFQPSIAGLPGGRVLIAGGLEKEGRPSAEAAIYDPVSGTLEQVCQQLSDHSEIPIASQAVSLWGGAMIFGALPEKQASSGILFRFEN
ncbi:MAG: hypothetical protein AAEJ04_03035 [Planctomycetota bacterium]